MKRTITFIVLAPIVLAYLMISFIVWNLDASQWSEGCRFAALVLSFGVGGISFGIAGASGAFDRPYQ